MKRSNTVLLAILGEAPGVLTETLWALARDHPALYPSEISIMTTQRGREILLRRITTRVMPKLHQDIHATLGVSLNIPSLNVKVFPSRNGLDDMEDLTNREDVEFAGDVMLRWVRGYAFEENTRIVASISGGRKSMTALLTTCMTLLGRPDDRMCHVHVPPPYDRPMEPPFLYPGQHKRHALPTGERVGGEDVPVTLIDMPFIPLHLMYRSYWGKSAARFSDMVAMFHKALDPDQIPTIELHSEGKRLLWEEASITLSEFDADFLARFWRRKTFPSGWHDFSEELDPEDCRKAAERVRRKLKAALVPIPEIQRLLPKFRGDPHPPHWPPKGLKIR